MRWIWEETEEGRVKRAKSLKIDRIEIFDDECTGQFTGSKGDVYSASLEMCTCTDFAIKQGKMPCKHIIRLGMEAGLINQNGNTPEQQLSADLQDLEAKLAIAAGYYHVIHKPLIKDKEYDQLKASYLELLNLSGETVEPVNIAKPAENAEEKSIDGPEVPAQSDVVKDSFGVAEAIFYLKSRNLEYIDKTATGGALWFFDLNAARDFKANGIKVNYSATGSRSNGKRPGWYIRSDQK